MAEILGMTVGLLSLSVQLFNSSQKLKHLYSASINASQKLSTLSDDVEMVALMLQNLEAYRQQSDVRDDTLLVRCIARMRYSAGNIANLVTTLETRLQRVRIFGKLSTAFKKPDVQRLVDELESAKSSLIIAHQFYVECVCLYEELTQLT